MLQLIQAEALMRNLQMAQDTVRVGMAVTFGVSFFLNGLVLQWRLAENPRSEKALRIARLFFYLATALTIAHATLAIVSPTEPLPQLVYGGIALVLALITLALDRGAQGLPALSFLSGAFIWLLTVITPTFFSQQTREPRAVNWLTGLHVFTAVASQGVFLVAFCGSLLYLWDYRRLKSKVLERKPFLPSLDSLDRLVERTSIVGLFLITTSLISGLALVFGGDSVATVGYTKFTWSFFVWGWYVLSIFGRGFWGWRGRKGAKLSLWGAAFMCLALFGTIWDKV